MSGNPKAADFPLPVGALANTSFPAIAGGIGATCTAVASAKPSSLRARRISGRRPKESKFEIVGLSQECAIRSALERPRVVGNQLVVSHAGGVPVKYVCPAGVNVPNQMTVAP